MVFTVQLSWWRYFRLSINSSHGRHKCKISIWSLIQRRETADITIKWRWTIFNRKVIVAWTPYNLWLKMWHWISCNRWNDLLYCKPNYTGLQMLIKACHGKPGVSYFTWYYFDICQSIEYLPILYWERMNVNYCIL